MIESFGKTQNSRTVANNEQYFGDAAAMREIERSLAARRNHLPESLQKHRSLVMERAQGGEQIDWDLFTQVVQGAEHYYCQKFPEFKLVPEERYYVTPPETGTLGGFFGKPLGGYYYMDDVGFTTYLDSAQVPNKTLRTMELARNYLHDCLHYSTFKEYRLDSESGMVWRHQYGINFRDADGNSYSLPNLNEQSPRAVNLNACMDAVIENSVGAFLKAHFTDKIRCDDLTDREKAIAQEIMDCRYDLPFPEADSFYRSIMHPVHGFMQHWGAGDLSEVILRAMVDGDLAALRASFAAKTGRSDGWEHLFRAGSAYRTPDEIQVSASAHCVGHPPSGWQKRFEGSAPPATASLLQ